jgi:uncharacterized membrane protein
MMDEQSWLVLGIVSAVALIALVVWAADHWISNRGGWRH